MFSKYRETKLSNLDGIENFYKVLNLLDEYEVYRYKFIEDNECILVKEDYNYKEKD